MLRINPDNLDVRFSIAWVLKELGQLEEAITKCKEVIEINPKHPRIHITLALALEKQNKFQESMEQYEIGINIDPDCACNYISLGVLLLELGHIDKGRYNLKKAKEIYHNQGDDSGVKSVDLIAASYDDISIKLINKYCKDRRPLSGY